MANDTPEADLELQDLSRASYTEEDDQRPLVAAIQKWSERHPGLAKQLTSDQGSSVRVLDTAGMDEKRLAVPGQKEDRVKTSKTKEKTKRKSPDPGRGLMRSLLKMNIAKRHGSGVESATSSATSTLARMMDDAPFEGALTDDMIKKVRDKASMPLC